MLGKIKSRQVLAEENDEAESKRRKRWSHVAGGGRYAFPGKE